MAVHQSGEIKLPLATPLLDSGDRVVPCFEPQSVIGYLPTLLTPEEGETPLAFIIKVPSWQTTTVAKLAVLEPSSGVCAEPLIQDLKMLFQFFPNSALKCTAI